MSSSQYIEKKNKDILILGKGPTQELDDTTLTAEAKYSIIFTQPRKIFVLRLHYNGSNSFLFVNATKIYQFKGSANFFSVDLNPIDTNNILDIHRY